MTTDGSTVQSGPPPLRYVTKKMEIYYEVLDNFFVSPKICLSGNEIITTVGVNSLTYFVPCGDVSPMGKKDSDGD